jgi:hypothetical protein
MEKAFEQALHELKEQLLFIQELTQEVSEHESLVSSVNRVAELQQKQKEADFTLRQQQEHPQDITLTSGYAPLAMEFTLESDVRYKLLRKLHYKIESINNVIKESRHRMKDTCYGIRHLLTKSDGVLAKYDSSANSDGAINAKDFGNIERHLSMRKSAVALLIECQENERSFETKQR